MAVLFGPGLGRQPAEGALLADTNPVDQAPIVVQAVDSQSGNLMEFRDPSGAVLSAVDVTGAFSGAGASPSGAVILAPASAGRNTIQPTVDTAEGLVIQGHSATQSARLLRVTDHTAVNSLLQVREPNTGNGFSVVAANGATGDVALWALNNISGDATPVFQTISGDAAGNPQITSFEIGAGLTNNSPQAIVAYLPDSNGDQQRIAAWAPYFRVNTSGSYRGGLRISVQDHTTDSVAMEATGDGAGNPQVGFLGATAVSRQVGASAAGIAAITDANAKAAVSALQTALANLGLVTSPA